MAIFEQAKSTMGRAYINKIAPLFIEVVKEGESVLFGDRAHEAAPMIPSECARSFMMEGFRAYHASPNDIPPMHSGETLTAALGESKRCLPRRDLGGGAGSMVDSVLHNFRGSTSNMWIANNNLEVGESYGGPLYITVGN